MIWVCVATNRGSVVYATATFESPIARKSAGVGFAADPTFSMAPVFGLLNQLAEAGLMNTAERSSSDIIVLVVLMFHSPVSELSELGQLPCQIRRLGFLAEPP
jgi:hypothetical protein